MSTFDTDIVIAGAGPAGLAAAAGLGTAGFSVTLLDPRPPVTAEADLEADLRTTAILQPGRATLAAAGIWDRLAPHATDLQVMRIVDAGGDRAEPRSTHDFDASDISEAPFGWNLPNWLLRREILARLDDLPQVDLRIGTGVRDVLTRETEARVTLTDGTRLRARLVIGADGRDSKVREAVGIGARTLRYGQKAMAFAVTHPIPHGNVSTEIHRSGGPFTLVPLPDRPQPDGTSRPASAIVWMERGPEVAHLLGLEAPAFEAEMSDRSAHLLGPLRLASRRTAWPIVSRLADRLSAQRTALIAEAGHVVPPIGAQGMNMSLKDIAVLVELATDAPDRLGDAAMLRAYHDRRYPEVAARVAGVDALNRTSMAGAKALRDLRRGALDAIYGVAPVRRTLMRAGLGATPKVAASADRKIADGQTAQG